MFGGHLSAHDDVLVINSFFEEEGIAPSPAFKVVDGKPSFCAGASGAPVNKAGTGTTRIYAGTPPRFDAPPREIGADPSSIPTIPRDMLAGLAVFGVLPTRLSVVGETWLVVSDASFDDFRGSVRYWPRNADPGTQDVIISAPAAAHGTFGRALALEGNVLVAGAPGEDRDVKAVGAAYVYVLGPERADPVTVLEPEYHQPKGWFGSAIAISSRWIVVAAPGDGTTGGDVDGLVYVFARDGDRVAGRVSIPSPAESGLFGASVALNGDWLAVGAPVNRIGGSLLDGRVFLYHHEGTEWNLVEDQTVTGSNGAFLGWAVAFAPGALLVTSPFEKIDHEGASLERAGALRIFEFGSTGIRGEPCELIAPNPTECDVFGNSLAVGRDFVAVGAPREDGKGPSGMPDEANELLDTGAVYVYPAKWTAE